jgi:hypothetical protein
LLDSVAVAAIPKDGDTFFDQVKKDMAALTAKYKEAPSKIFDLSPTYSTNSEGWLAVLHDLERNVAILIGSSNGLPPALTDAKGKPSKVAVAEPAALAALQDFRTQVELFYDAATTVSFGPAAAPAP